MEINANERAKINAFRVLLTRLVKVYPREICVVCWYNGLSWNDFIDLWIVDREGRKKVMSEILKLKKYPQILRKCEIWLETGKKKGLDCAKNALQAIFGS